MTVLAALGPTITGLDIGNEDDRVYGVYFLVPTVKNPITGKWDVGPNEALLAPGLPLPGSPWIWEAIPDDGVVCLPEVSVKPHERIESGTPVNFWKLIFKYTNDLCYINEHEDPLLRPQKVRYGSNKYAEEAAADRFGVPIQNSSYEQYRGKIVEFDDGRIQVTIEQNVPDLELDLLAKVLNMVNDDEMWGLPKRCWKFCDFDGEMKCRGQSEPYFTRKLVFEAKTKVKQGTTEDDPDHLESGWDRDIPDEGTKALKGRWVTGADGKTKWVLRQLGTDADGDPVYPSWRKPIDFERVTDERGNPMKVILNGRGEPWDPDWVPPSKFWCIRAMNPPVAGGTVTATSISGTCTNAITQLNSLAGEFPGSDYKLFGPYDDETTADAVCSVALDLVRMDDEYDQSFCANEQGMHHVEKYDEVDLFDALGVPTDLSVFTPYEVSTSPFVGP